MSKRKQSMKPPDVTMGRKQSIHPRMPSVEGKKSLDFPGYVGGRRSSIDSLGRRLSVDYRRMSMGFGSLATRRHSIAGSLLSRAENHSAKERSVIKYENTYRLGPENIFPANKVKAITLDVLESHLKDLTYDADDCPKLSRTLTETVKQEVKALGNSRYKIVVMVAIGQLMDTHPSISVTSRCIWNDKLDNFVEVIYKNKSLYAIGLVYWVYAD